MCVEPLIVEILKLNKLEKYRNTNELRICMYADDMKLYIHVESDEDHNKLKEALELIQEFCKKSQMSVNTDKTCVMKVRKTNCPKDDYKYQIDGVELKTTPIFDDLGVIITENMDSGPHYQKIRNKIRRTVAITKKNFWKRSQNLVTNIYKTYVVSVATQGAAILFKCPPLYWPDSRNTGIGNAICTMLRHQTNHVFDLCHLRKGIEANLSLPRQCSLSWLRTMNRMILFSETPGNLKFSDCWKKSLTGDRIIPTMMSDANTNDWGLLENGHKFYNQVPKSIREANPIGEKTLIEICKYRAKKIRNWFCKKYGVVDYKKAQEIYVDKVRDEKRKVAREKAKELRKAKKQQKVANSGNAVTATQPSN